MISSYSLLAAALAVIASHTTPAVASSFVSNQLIGDHIVKRTLLEEGDDPFLMVSKECLSEMVIVQARIEEEVAAGNLSYSCKDAGGKDIKVEFEGTCPFSTGEGFITEYGTQSGDSDCVGTSCTVEELQAFFDAMVTGGQSSYEGCSNFKVSFLDDYQDDTPLEEEGDDLQLISVECESEFDMVQARIEEQFAAGNLSYSCKDAGGKVFKLEFEGTCPALSTIDEDGFFIDASDPNCVGTSCTVNEFQARIDVLVSTGQSSASVEGCYNFKVSFLDDYQDDTPLEEEGDDLQLISVECESEFDMVQARIEEQFAAGNLSYSCKDAGGKVFKLEFEGTCPALSTIDEDGFFIDASDPNCAGTSCTVNEFQARIDVLVSTGQSSASVEGCYNFKVSSPEESSGAFSLGTAGCILASLLLSTAALLN